MISTPDRLFFCIDASPGMDLSVRLELGNRNKDDNSLFSTFDVDFFCGADLERTELGLELWDV